MRKKLGIQIRKMFRRPRIDRSSLFVFGSVQLIKAWILSGGICFLLVGYGEAQVGDICLYYLGFGLGHPITPGSQGPKEFGSMLEAEFLGWATKEEVIYVLEEMTRG